VCGGGDPLSANTLSFFKAKNVWWKVTGVTQLVCVCVCVCV